MPERPAERFLAALAAGDDPSAAVRTVLVMAHPDDETVGLGAQLPQLRQARLVTVTDGAPRDLRDARAAGFARAADYAAARRRELEEAMTLAGIARDRLASLGIADQGAALALAELTRRLADLLDGAALVVTHPYEGGHPDHDATAFAVHAACALIGRRGRPAPDIVEASFYHDRGGAMATGAFLPAGNVRAVRFDLDAARRDLKRRMVACFATQQAVLAPFPLDRELLRPAPAYRFTSSPAAAALYDRFDWGMRSERWRTLAAAALAELDLGEPL